MKSHCSVLVVMTLVSALGSLKCREIALPVVQAAEGTGPTATGNLLRNGSFEGGLLYWHGVDADKQKLIRGDAAVGEYALRIDKGYVMSAPFVATLTK